MGKEHKRFSLQKATVTIFIIIFLLFSMMFSVSVYLIVENANNDYKKKTSETAVNNAVATLKSTMTNYNYLTRLLMINDKIVTYLKADRPNKDEQYEAVKGIYEIQNLYSYIDSVFVFRNDQRYVSTERTLYFIDMESDEYKKILEARGSTLFSINGNGMIRKSTEDQLLTLARAIYDINSQEQIGILIMNVSSKFFDNTLVKQSDEELCISDIYGNLLCGDERLLNMSLAEGEALATVTFENIELDGKHKILAKSDRAYPFTVLCCSGKTYYVGSPMVITALIITLVAFLGSILIWMLFISKNIVKPIGILSDAMENTKSSGWLMKLDAKMPSKELGSLADNYNTMIEYLNELFKQTIQNEKVIQKAEMQVLQEQIKPHFLYNTLETISYLALEENATNAHEALEHLGSFYRNFLSKGDKEITIKREIRITQDYLSLQKLRYGEIFEAEYDIDEKSMDCMLPKLILQPLVENAIYHGIRPKGDLCKIKIITRLSGNQLILTIFDSGIGMTKEKIEEVLDEKSQKDDRSFGLAETINRVRYFCNKKDIVTIRSEIGEFTEIEFILPAVWEYDLKGEQ